MKQIRFISYIMLLTLCIHTAANGARILIEPVRGGQVDVYLDTEEISINAVEGSFEIPKEVTVTSFSTVDSIVPVWISRPAHEGSIVSWEGMIPGGFMGSRSPFYEGVRPGFLFSMFYSVSGPVEGMIIFKDTEAYVNDGAGTPTTLEGASQKILFLPGAVPIQEETSTTFSAYITQDESAAEGKWFVTVDIPTTQIAVQDVLITESNYKDPSRVHKEKWHKVQNPYILEYQSRTRYVHIKVVTIDGKEQVLTLDPVAKKATNIVQWAILFLIIITVYFYMRRKHYG